MSIQDSFIQVDCKNNTTATIVMVEAETNWLSYLTAVLFPFLFLIGVIGNILNVVILRQWGRTEGFRFTYIILISVACSDLTGM